MASQTKDEDIQCEYVYDQNKSVSQNEASIFDREYSEEDSDKDDKNPHVKVNLATNKGPEKSKLKRRSSRYDENMYALPDSDDEADMIIVKEELKARETQLLSQKGQLFAWKTAFIVLICFFLISVMGNCYLTVKISSKGIQSFTIYYTTKIKRLHIYLFVTIF